MAKEAVTRIEKEILESVYSGNSNIDEKEKNVRKALRLPLTKSLRYYRNKNDASSSVPVSSFRIIEIFEITDPWYTLEITLSDDNSKVKIHSWFFSHMQKPSFIEDMQAQKEE